jgi:hypothetical protein
VYGVPGEVLDAVLVTVLLELDRVELATAVTAKRSELAITLSLSQRLDALKALERLIFGRQ